MGTRGLRRLTGGLGAAAVLSGTGLLSLGTALVVTTPAVSLSNTQLAGQHSGGKGSADTGGADYHGGNSGDVWLDAASETPPMHGHEQDSHLPCAQINLWGANLADSGAEAAGSGDPANFYAIDSWPPSGNQQPAGPDFTHRHWHYAGPSKTSQIIDTFSGPQLVAEAIASGATASNQGFHFKLDFSQDPQKHKTFWIDCPAPSGGSSSSSSSGGGGGSGTSTSSSTSSNTSSGSSSASSSGTGSVSGTASSSSSGSPTGSVSGISVSGSGSVTGGVSGANTTGGAHGGVQGISTGPGTPFTGANLPFGLGLLLILGGLGSLQLRRRLRR